MVPRTPKFERMSFNRSHYDVSALVVIRVRTLTHTEEEEEEVSFQISSAVKRTKDRTMNQKNELFPQ